MTIAQFPGVMECLQHPLQPPRLRVRRLAGAMAQPDDVAPELSPNGSDLDTARPLCERVVRLTGRFKGNARNARNFPGTMSSTEAPRLRGAPL